MSVISPRIVNPWDARTLVHLLSTFPYSCEQELAPATLTDTLRQLLEQQAVSGVMLVQHQPAASTPSPLQSPDKDTILSFAITAFVAPDTARRLIETAPDTPLVHQLYARETAGEAVFLRPDDQARCNREHGMTLVFLHFFAPPAAPDDPKLQQAVAEIHRCFRLQHGGHRCVDALHPVPGAQDSSALDSLLALGFQPQGEGQHMLYLDLAALDRMPFHPFVCLRRTEDPKLAFSPAEKRLLTLALWGYADGAVADKLHVSGETIRKRWRNIYQKIEDHPELNLFTTAPAAADSTRGPEKRSVVLQYVESHLCEIRP